MVIIYLVGSFILNIEGDRMYIKYVSVTNFRSIKSQKIYLNNLNIIVGNNDTGKSNFLRALNLFFNGETSTGEKYNFDTDFCRYYNRKNKKAREIIIEIMFTPPKSFSDREEIIWRKIWRKKGLYKSEKMYSDGSGLNKRKRTDQWLRQLKYKYVPAIKGTDYFSNLLSDLHDVLAGTISRELKQASKEFIDSIRRHTDEISSNLSNCLGFESALQIPDDLSSFFKILDFETKKEDKSIALRCRGDGIKVRHIPVILKFISEQENINKYQGRVKSNTIWGYEEPENNLELSKAYEQAKEFIGYSNKIQVLITTHSPAFYSLGKEEDNQISTFYVNHSHKIESFDYDSKNLDRDLGLLPFITPYVDEVVREKKELIRIVKEKQSIIKSYNDNCLFVEGPTDKTILEKAIRVLKPELLSQFRIIANDIGKGGGYNWVKDMIISWHFSRKTKRAAALFDYDHDTSSAIELIEDTLKASNKSKRSGDKRYIKIFKLKDYKPRHLRSIFSKSVTIPFAIEEYFEDNVWKYAENEGWLKDKSTLLKYNDNFKILDRSFYEYCKTVKGLSDNELLYFKEIKKESKIRFADFINDLDEEHSETKTILSSFEGLINSFDAYYKEVIESN